MKNWKIPFSNDPQLLVSATRDALIEAMRDVVNSVRSEGIAGLTWKQLDFLFEEFCTKEILCLEANTSPEVCPQCGSNLDQYECHNVQCRCSKEFWTTENSRLTVENEALKSRVTKFEIDP